MFELNQDQLLNLTRNVVSLIGGVAIGHGWISTDQLTLIAGIATSLVPLFTSYVSQSSAAKVAAAAKVSGVEKVVISQTAPAAVQEVAKDAAMPNVVPKI